MAGIISNVDSDVQKLRKLKNEIEEVKKALKGINIKVDIDIAKGMEAQLKSLTDQYHALITKIAEAEGKIMLSTKRINDASEKIIQAQEKLSKVTGVTSQLTAKQNTPSNVSETANIQLQAKAYDELRDEIDSVIGTRSQNIKRMIEESNAIRLINAEIKKITKSQGESSTLSSAQQKRLEQLNNSLLTHKTALSEVRQTLNNNVKLDNAAATSMNELSQSLSRMRIAYRELTEEERNSPIGKELLASINQADAKIKELDATIGNHQRNVGDYAKQWNGLQYQMQMVARELPNFAINPQIGIMSLTNNIPYLVDELKKAKDAHKAYIAEVKAGNKELKTVPSVGRQVLSSLLNWQTAIIMGITLITAYRKEITNWASSLFSAKKALSETYQSLEDYQKKAGETSGSVLATLERLSEGWKRLGSDVDAQKKYILDNKDAINSMGVSVNDAAEAERLFNSNKDTFVLGILQRAKAAATMELAAEEYKKAVQKMMEADAMPDKKTHRYSTATNVIDIFKASTWQTIEYDNPDKLAAQKQAEDFIKSGTQLIQKYAQFSEEERKALESIGIKTTKTIIEGSVEAIEAVIALKQQSLKKVTDPKEYKRIEAEIKVEQAKLRAITGEPLKSSQAEKLRKEQEKYNLLASRQELERIRTSEDLENQVSQSKIDAMEAGFEKEQAQRELNNKLEIQSIQRQKEDYIQAAIKAQKDLFDAQEELKAKQNKGYIKKSFDPSSVSVDTSAFDTIITYTSKRQQNDKVRSQEEAWNEYLLKFGNYQQKRQAIIEKYDKQIKEAGPAGDAAILEKNKQNALDELDNSVINSTTLMGQLFADASQKGVGEIQKIIDWAELLIDYLAGTKDEEGNITIGGVAYNDASIAKTVGISGNTLQNLQSSPEEVEALTNAIRNLKSELGAKSPFKLFETQVEDAVKKIKSGGKDSMAQGIADIGNAIVSFSPAIKQFGSDLASIFGEELNGDIANVIDGVSGLGQTAAGIGQIMSGDIVGGVMGVVGGISQVVNAMGSLFGPDGTAYYEGIKEQLEAINSVYDKIIDKSKEDIVFGGFSSIEAASTALDN